MASLEALEALLNQQVQPKKLKNKAIANAINNVRPSQDMQTETNTLERPEYVDTMLGQMQKPNFSEIFSPENTNKAIREGGSALVGGAPMLSSIEQGAKSALPLMEQANIPVISNLLKKAPKAIQGLGKYTGNVAKGTGLGVAASEKPLEDLGQSALVSSIVESIIPGGKLIGKVAEKAHPIEYAKDLAKKIFGEAGYQSERASKEFQDIENKFGNYNILQTKDAKNYNKFLKLGPAIKQHFGPDIESFAINYKKNTNYKNAKALQEQIGSEIGTMKGKKLDRAQRRELNALNQAYNSITKDIKYFLGERNPKYLNKFEKGTDIVREESSKYGINDYIKKIITALSHNVEPEINPKKLSSNVQKLEESGKLERTSKMTPSKLANAGLEKEHFLKAEGKNLKSKVNQGKLISALMSMAGGAGLGTLTAGPVGAAIGGLLSGAGSLLGSHYGRSAFEIAQNPELIKALKALEPYIEKSTKQAPKFMNKLNE